MTSRLNRAGAAGALSLALVVLPLTCLPAQAADGTRELQLLNINDFHGRISMDIGLGLANTVQQQRAENSNSVLLSAGDNVSASLYVSSVQDDEPTISYLNALGLKASAAGNHEFDRGLTDLQNRISQSADFPILGANVTDKATGKPALEPFTIVTSPDGTKIGVIGTVTTETPQLTDPSALASVNFGDTVAATNKYADQLSDGNEANGEADVIVAEYHQGVDVSNLNDPIVANTSPKVDAIFTGHTHQEYVMDAPVPGEAGKTRPVIQTGNYGDNLGDVTLSLDSQNNVVGYTSTLHKRAVSPTPEEIAADPVLTQTNKILTDANAYAAEKGNEKVATLKDKITTGWDPAKAANRGGFDQRDRESTMGHLVADMYLSAANSTGRTPADIGIVNPGGLRDEFPNGLRTSLSTAVGDLKVADAVAVTPFANNLWTTELTGAQLKQVLEEQWQQDAAGNMAARPYLQLGLSKNVTYTYSGTADAAGYAQRGNHIQQIFVNGKEVQDSDTFTIAVPSFLLGGGDNFTTLSKGINAKDTALVDSDAFVNYLREQGTVSARYEKQGVRVENVAKSYDLAGKLTFDVSNLATQSYGVPALSSLDVAVDGVKIGTVPVQDGAAKVDLSLAGHKFSAGQHEVTLTDPTGVVGTQVRTTVELAGTSASEFSDVTPDYQFYNEITWLANTGITTGWEDGTFRPHEQTERAAMAAFFYRAAGSPEYTAPATSQFTDVKPGDPFYKEISWLADQGITTGWDDGTFRPHEKIQRGAMAAFFYRFAGKPYYVAPSHSQFSDLTPQSPFYKEISWMYTRGIATGWDDGTFRPADSINRDATAAFFYRYSQHVGTNFGAKVK